MLRGEALRHEEPAFLLLSLVAFDAIVTEADLESAWCAFPTLYRDGESVCLEWCSANGGQDRRILSPVTVLSWSAQGRREARLAHAVETLMSRLSVGIDPPTRRIRTEVPRSFQQLLDWTRHALLSSLSGDLFAHVSGGDPLTAVPRSCLARQRRRLALRVEPPVDILASDANSTMVLMDALRLGESDRGAALVDQIRDACRPDPDEPNVVAQRRRMLADLLALAPGCAAAGFWASLLLLWTIDLVRSGTRRKSPVSPYTSEVYVALTIIRLWRALRELSPDLLAEVDLQRLYEVIIADPGIEASQRGKAAAALTSFHEYIETLLDVPPLRRALDAEVPVLSPRANVVWPHEMHWILDRLAEASGDDRLARQLEAVVALLMGACLRMQDAWHIHVFGVQPFDNVVVVAIDPLPSAGSGKSVAARRQVEIHEPRCRALLSRWHERRLAEGALSRDLLFGDPGEPRRAWRAGATEFLLNRWLKAATGDADIGTHTLRHSFASLTRHALADEDQRGLDQLSARAGHAATRTTLVNYVHLFEASLRQQLDRSIHCLRLIEMQVCRLSATRPGWLRKRWQRSASDPVGIAWAAIEESAARIDMPDVAGDLAFESPRAPETARSPIWSFDSVLQCLADLAKERSPDQVRLRRGISDEQWRSLEGSVQSWRDTAPADARRWAEPASDEHLPWSEGFTRIGHEKLAPVLRSLQQTTDPNILRPVCTAWRQLLHGCYLSLAQVAAALPLLQWLADAGVRPAQLVISHQTVHHDPALAAALEVIETVFGELPCVHAEQPRRGRPPMYLSLRTASAADSKPSNAGLAMAGFHSLMFSAWVWCDVSRSAS
jgi:integrase